MDNSLKQPIEEQIRAAARQLEPRPEFSAALWQKMANHAPQTAPARRQWWTRPAWGLALSALTIAALAMAVGPQRVAAAFQSLLRYLPGVGFVEQDESALYLPEPVTVTQGAASLTVEQAAADSKGLTLTYHIDGVDNSACFYSDNRVELPDGKTWLPSGGGMEGNTARIEFFPLPEGVKQVTLIASLGDGVEGCDGPDEWRAALALGTAAPGGVRPALPVAQTAAPDADAPIHLTVEQMVALEDGWMVSGRVTWDDPTWSEVYALPEALTVRDANGESIPFEWVDEGGGQGAFSLRLKQRDLAGPLTLTAERALVTSLPEDGPSFTFDAGANPQVGQRWEIGQTLTLGSGEVKVLAVEYVAFENGARGYAIETEHQGQTNWTQWRYSGAQPVGHSFGEGFEPSETLSVIRVGFPDGAPVGEVAFQLTGAQFTANGPWDVTWEIPAE